MSNYRGQRDGVRSPSFERQTVGTEAASGDGLIRAVGSEDLVTFVFELRLQEQSLRRRLREGSVSPEVLLQLSDSQAAVRAAQRSFEKSGNTSLLILDHG